MEKRIIIIIIKKKIKCVYLVKKDVLGKSFLATKCDDCDIFKLIVLDKVKIEAVLDNLQYHAKLAG